MTISVRAARPHCCLAPADRTRDQCSRRAQSPHEFQSIICRGDRSSASKIAGRDEP